MVKMGKSGRGESEVNKEILKMKIKACDMTPSFMDQTETDFLKTD